MPKWKGYPFDGSNLIDGRFDTSWQPAKKDTIGVGEWVELDLGAAYQIDHIEIVQGLQKVDPKLGDLFCRNNRFAEAYLFFDDGTHAPTRPLRATGCPRSSSSTVARRYPTMLRASPPNQPMSSSSRKIDSTRTTAGSSSARSDPNTRPSEGSSLVSNT